MWKRMTYADVAKIAKVGMKVRRAAGYKNDHNFSGEESITNVSSGHLFINGCCHLAAGYNYLEVFMEDNTVQQQGRMTFRLKKETAELKKGAIIQEQCDDGYQDYIVLEPDTYVKYESEEGKKCYIAPRESVEKEPAFWERVYPATPAWLNAEEQATYADFIKPRSTKTKTTKKQSKK